MSELPPPTPPPPAPPAAPPAQPAAPAGRSVDEIKSDPLVASAVSRVGDAITGAKEFATEITLFVDRDRIVDVCRAFKDDGFVYLVDLAGVDYSKFPNHTGPRFGVSYTLYSFQKNDRVRLRVWTDEATPIPSVTPVWKTANWHERETFDMFGIQFSGHPNLERILMWEGFNGHPLRKDFPVRGIDTGARIYPEVFPEGGGPKAGSTGKPVSDVNIYKGEWKKYGTWPVAQIGGGAKPAAAPAAKPAPKPVAAAPAAAPAAAAPAAPAAAEEGDDEEIN
ncbi:MAG TPA: NADH-quinone oxidoreductase subunit C [Thermoanaerobaculia bacterium]|nr:NADH-quinone oxidoreductase subunit C [Thermoanaerobaculia bacterium]